MENKGGVGVMNMSKINNKDIRKEAWHHRSKGDMTLSRYLIVKCDACFNFSKRTFVDVLHEFASKKLSLKVSKT